jgi:hypothetical protein
MATPPDNRSCSPDKPDLKWTPEIEEAIARWQQTGVFPFPNLNLCQSPIPEAYSIDNLRLIYYVAEICAKLEQSCANGLTIWTRLIPEILSLGVDHTFVMEALLAFSASHMANVTDCPLVKAMAFEREAKGIKGLSLAIQQFNKDNFDAILAASLVLSWQVTDWKSWIKYVRGVSDVIRAIADAGWTDQSRFRNFIHEISPLPTAPPSPIPSRRLDGLKRKKEEEDLLARTCKQLNKLDAYLKKCQLESKPITSLLSFVKGVRKLNLDLDADQQFERICPFRLSLFWVPTTCLTDQELDPAVLVTIAHFYAVALLLERLFPEIGVAYFGSLSIRPIEEIAQRLCAMSQTGHHLFDVSFMDFPLEMVDDFRARSGCVPQERTQLFASLHEMNAPTLYINQGTMSPLTPSAYSPLANESLTLSNEDLSSLLTQDLPSTGPVNDMAMASPYVHNQYLGVPWQGYGDAAYSPASSTFGGDGSVWSDQDDSYVMLNNSMTAPSPVFPHSPILDLGFVTPMMPQQTVFI